MTSRGRYETSSKLESDFPTNTCLSGVPYRHSAVRTGPQIRRDNPRVIGWREYVRARGFSRSGCLPHRIPRWTGTHQPVFSILRHAGHIRFEWPAGGVNFWRQRRHRFPRRSPLELVEEPIVLAHAASHDPPGRSRGVCESTGVVHCGRCQGPAVAPRRQPTGCGNTDSLQVHVSGAPRCCAVPRCESIRYEAMALDRASIPVMHAQGAVGARYAPRGSRDRARPSSAGSGAAVPQA